MTSSGNKLYSEFGQQKADLERKARAVSQEIITFDGSRRTMLERQNDLWTQLSKMRIATDSALPQATKSAMEDRTKRIEQTEQDIEGFKTALSSMKRERDKVATEVDTLGDILEAEVTEAEKTFEADHRTAVLRDKLTEVKATLSTLVSKRDRADEEVSVKRVAFEEDKFFMYLNRRSFGKPAYKATGLVQRLDSALAKKINFREEQANYDRLLAIPSWVEERIAPLASEKESLKQQLSALRDEFISKTRDRQNLLDKKKASLSKIEHDIDEVDRKMAQANGFIRDAALAEDAHMDRIASDFAAMLKKVGISKLKSEARLTASTEDDAILSEMEQIDLDFARTQEEVAHAKSQLRVLEERIGSIERVQAKMRRENWNDSDHRFRSVDASHIAYQLAAGSMSENSVLSTLNRSHEDPPRRSSEFGSSSSSSGSTWGSSSSSSSYSTNDSFGGGSSSSYTTSDSF
jgi:chromosome segregation ATPase